MLRDAMRVPTTTRRPRVMKQHFDFKPPRALFVAWAITLLATASYLALVQQFELKSILLTLFVGATVAVIAYWLPAETVCLFEDSELPAEHGIEESR
jgi:hypothetical protein